MMISKGAPREGGGFGIQPPPPRKEILKKKNTDFEDKEVFYVMYPAAEISHGNRLVISILEF